MSQDSDFGKAPVRELSLSQTRAEIDFKQNVAQEPIPDLPAWQSHEARLTYDPSSKRRGKDRRWGVIIALAGVCVGVGLTAGLFILLGNEGQSSTQTLIDKSTTTVDRPVDDPDIDLYAGDLPDGDEEDRMSIQIETESSVESGGATATVKSDGRVHFEGFFRSQTEADRYLARAREVFGEDSVVESYSIDKNAPPPTVNEVVLDKPVLFESGSAEIHPDYIPFLEACGDVLKLNSTITMSIAAYTDTLGDDEINLELSQKRAQAIVDFYLDMAVDSSQLTGTGFGESGLLNESNTPEDRAENRRAMLKLLNVMDDA